ncbi:sugar 3,4-ketoisomerase [Candidatus Agathobaculum pullicola]|uniref:sugar 3,4-ketoisomerase n=1 Tax=Candidatus Agathobaculum pullicola TaxID=2838426 RepID=UPI003F8D9724
MGYVNDVNVLQFKQNGDQRGHLVVVEGNKDIPFSIARIFYIYGSDREVVRGCHANRRSEFVLINVSGTSKVKVMDGKAEKVIVLDKPHMGVYLPEMVWKEMYDFSEDSVLLCIASEVYDPSEYIRDYAEYLKEIGMKDE